MGKNVILSEETVRDLLEAHASLSAWYYELWAALRAANGSAHPPDDAARAAFVERLAVQFPEVAAIARAIHAPRMYVPPPPPARSVVPSPLETPETVTLVEPAPARLREIDSAPPEAADATGPAPPPMVDPNAVRYDGKE